MNIWIITTGSSDVQLKKNKDWNSLCSKVRSQLKTSKQFSLSESDQSGQKRWLVPSRAMGVVYSQALTEHYDDLDFPLLNSFCDYLKSEKIELNRIIVLLTDQVNVVNAVNKDKPSHPYWQDTCTLKPILQHYLKIAFPDVVMDNEPDFLVLKPKSGSAGLDDWNEVLDLVQQEFVKLDIPKDATVYVSHQAGTPAISSAVQFSSLAKFRTNVQFLVSNEYSQEIRPISSSTYLKAIQLQEVNALLAQHDYVGVRDILGLTKIASNNAEKERIKYLLDAAEQWNFAEFQKFKKIVSEHNLFPQTSFPWWKIGYESTYLAWVRLKQGSPVDAMFHSFRAVEGSAGLWAEKKYRQHIRRDQKKGLQLNQSICESLNNMKTWFEKGKTGQYKQEIGLYGKSLFALVRESKTNWQSNPCIAIFCNPIDQQYQGKDIFQERNNLFHRLEGLQNQELFNAWDVANKDEWIARVICCLNFIAKEDLPQEFTSLEEASLMAKVHDELVDAIARYELQT
jgi:hypothetical protein